MSQGEGGGRPPKFTPERCAEIIDNIAHHVPYQIAAEAAGISERSLYSWMEQGERDRDAGLDTDFSKFLQDIKSAEQKKIRSHAQTIEEMPERWQAKGWLLERRYWKHFSNNAPLVEFKKQLDEMKALLEKDNGKAESKSKE